MSRPQRATAKPAPRGGPTVMRILVGAQLRRLRRASGTTPGQAARAIRASNAKISRMELGRVGFKERDIADLLTLYGVTDPHHRETLLGMARQANAPGWWREYHDVLPSWFESYIGLEDAASVVRTFEVQFIPALLQTPGYARAVIKHRHKDATEREVEQRVAVRMRRQERLTGPDPLRLWAVVDEAALRRPFGGTKVLRGQIEHLIEITTMPNVTLQVLPFDRGGHSAAAGPFTILRFESPDLPDVVYMEQLNSAAYLDKPAETEPYLRVMNALSVEAHSPARSRAFLERLLDGLG